MSAPSTGPRGAVCVFCSSSQAIDPRYAELAGQVGTELARRGLALVSGGGSVSMMGAVARGARAGGGRTIGVIPRALLDHEVADDDADELVVTTDMRERKGEMDSRAQAFLALPGGLGTLEELLEIWVSRTLAMHSKPVVVLDPEDLFAGLRRQVEDLVEAGFVRAQARDAVVWGRSAAEALDLIEAAWHSAEVAPAAPEPARAGELLEAEP
jgi:uncharacterized protein (TIGR00730 family)